MGFMDKAKKMAEQAQQKLDEVQKDFNKGQGSTGQGQQGGGTAVEYDKHGRPVSAQEPAAPAGPSVGLDAPVPDPAAPGAAPDSSPAKQQGDPLLSDEPGSRHGADAERGDVKPPTPPSSGSGMTSGDPLAG
jgi:hypothetical protein